MAKSADRQKVRREDGRVKYSHEDERLHGVGNGI